MRYFTAPGDTIATRSQTEWVAPEGWSEISAKLYAALLAEHDAQRDQDVAAREARALKQAHEDYDALITAGVPEGVARRLSKTEA